MPRYADLLTRTAVTALAVHCLEFEIGYVFWGGRDAVQMCRYALIAAAFATLTLRASPSAPGMGNGQAAPRPPYLRCAGLWSMIIPINVVGAIYRTPRRHKGHRAEITDPIG